MPSSDAYALQRSDLNGFLFADVGVEASGMTLSVISALARLGVDPWQEAGRLAKLPRTAAVEGLARIISAMPASLWSVADATPIAARLVALLPSRGVGASAVAVAVAAKPTKSRLPVHWSSHPRSRGYARRADLEPPQRPRGADGCRRSCAVDIEPSCPDFRSPHRSHARSRLIRRCNAASCSQCARNLGSIRLTGRPLRRRVRAHEHRDTRGDYGCRRDQAAGPPPPARRYGTGTDHGRIRRRPERHCHLFSSRRPVRLRAGLDHAVQLPPHVRHSADQRRNRARDRDGAGREPASPRTTLADVYGGRTPDDREHHQYRCRPRCNGRGRQPADRRPGSGLRRRLRRGVRGSPGLRPLFPLRLGAEMAHPLPVGLRGDGICRASALGRGPAPGSPPARHVHHRNIDRRGGRAWHDDQSLPVLLASRGGSGGGAGESCRAPAPPGTGAGAT